MSPLDPKRNLPRLAPECYRGHAVVRWTITLEKRARGWLNEVFHLRFRELMLYASARESLWCPTDCLMPDHLHLVWMGMRRESDQRNALRFLRQRLATLLKPHRLQAQSHDHVLREVERERGAFASACFYILANPLRAMLVNDLNDWPFTGAILPGYPDLHPAEEDFWPLFWKLYAAERGKET
jgi:REP element-mobilizing transposase RayT